MPDIVDGGADLEVEWQLPHRGRQRGARHDEHIPHPVTGIHNIDQKRGPLAVDGAVIFQRQRDVLAAKFQFAVFTSEQRFRADVFSRRARQRAALVENRGPQRNRQAGLESALVAGRVRPRLGAVQGVAQLADTGLGA